MDHPTHCFYVLPSSVRQGQLCGAPIETPGMTYCKKHKKHDPKSVEYLTKERTTLDNQRNELNAKIALLMRDHDALDREIASVEERLKAALQLERGQQRINHGATSTLYVKPTHTPTQVRSNAAPSRPPASAVTVEEVDDIQVTALVVHSSSVVTRHVTEMTATSRAIGYKYPDNVSEYDPNWYKTVPHSFKIVETQAPLHLHMLLCELYGKPTTVTPGARGDNSVHEPHKIGWPSPSLLAADHDYMHITYDTILELEDKIVEAIKPRGRDDYIQRARDLCYKIVSSALAATPNNYHSMIQEVQASIDRKLIRRAGATLERILEVILA